MIDPKHLTPGKCDRCKQYGKVAYCAVWEAKNFRHIEPEPKHINPVMVMQVKLCATCFEEAEGRLRDTSVGTARS